LTQTEQIRRRHIVKMLTDLESIGHITEADKTIIKFHVQNLTNDLAAVKVNGDDDGEYNR
jgi:hypothetical protein